MFSLIWPITLVVFSNVIYHISAKSAPAELNPLASLTVTYLIGALASGMLYFILNRGGNLLKEYEKLNWTPFVLGIVIVGLEAGFLYAYKAGWQVSKAALVQSTFLAIALIFAGRLIYGEQLTWNKLVGAAICLIGLAIINFR